MYKLYYCYTSRAINSLYKFNFSKCIWESIALGCIGLLIVISNLLWSPINWNNDVIDTLIETPISFSLIRCLLRICDASEITAFVPGGYFCTADDRVYTTRVDVNFLLRGTRNYGMKIRILSVSDWRQLQRALSSEFTTLRERERECRAKGLRVDFHFFSLASSTTPPPPPSAPASIPSLSLVVAFRNARSVKLLVESY